MPRPRPQPAADVDVHRAQWRLCRLSVYAEGLAGPRGQALLELKMEHYEKPVPAQEAYRSALRVLGAGVAEFERWADSRDGRSSRWPTLEDVHMRARVRAVEPN